MVVFQLNYSCFGFVEFYEVFWVVFCFFDDVISYFFKFYIGEWFVFNWDEFLFVGLFFFCEWFYFGFQVDIYGCVIKEVFKVVFDFFFGGKVNYVYVFGYCYVFLNLVVGYEGCVESLGYFLDYVVYFFCFGVFYLLEVGFFVVEFKEDFVFISYFVEFFQFFQINVVYCFFFVGLVFYFSYDGFWNNDFDFFVQC